MNSKNRPKLNPGTNLKSIQNFNYPTLSLKWWNMFNNKLENIFKLQQIKKSDIWSFLSRDPIFDGESILYKFRLRSKHVTVEAKFDFSAKIERF